MSVLAVGGFDKLTVVVGPFLIIASFFSLLRQTGRLDLNVEVPLLVITTGVLMILPFLDFVPNPSWYHEAPLSENRGHPSAGAKQKTDDD